MPDDVVKGAVLISGLYDLKPVRLSSRSAYVRFDDEVEHRLSPMRHLDRIRSPLVVIYGTNESPEFIRQSKEFSELAAARGKRVQLLAAKGYNHFEVLETLASPFGLAGRAALAQIASS
ncbi:dipeptidyl aminopeptidase/acylaminoacyl peptidase [Pseudacidovorax sp. 1753]|uniref:alpha/beta hydrolase family protein n=1 Tax=Pseudacidovorax sp. 1753 TaxID=3156419 RepID=UPI003392515A